MAMPKTEFMFLSELHWKNDARYTSVFQYIFEVFISFNLTQLNHAATDTENFVARLPDMFKGSFPATITTFQSIQSQQKWEWLVSKNMHIN